MIIMVIIEVIFPAIITRLDISISCHDNLRGHPVGCANPSLAALLILSQLEIGLNFNMTVCQP